MTLNFNRTTIALIAFLVIGGYLLLTEHAAHIWPFLPWLIFLACPLIHLFMHRGHGHGHGDRGSDEHKQHDTPVPPQVSDTPPPESTRVPLTGGRRE